MAPHLKDSLNRNFFDLLGTFRQISSQSVQNQIIQQKVEAPEYLTLYSPAINWILQCIAYRAPEVSARTHTHKVLPIKMDCFKLRDNFMMLTFFTQALLTEMMERCKKLVNK